MELKDRIESDFKSALKARDVLRTSCLRMIKAAIISKEMESSKSKVDDAVVMGLLSALAKKAAESIEHFEKGSRPELAEKEKQELEIIKSYLPTALSEEEVTALVVSAIAEVNASGPKDMGKVMKVLMPKVAGRADGKLVSGIVQKKLL